MLLADPRPRLVKIVRTGVAQFLGSGEVYYRPADPEDIVPELRKKLLEEVGEYLVEPCLGELADVWEVVRALAIHDLKLPNGMNGVQGYAMRKADERGDFDAAYGMYVTTNAPHEFEENGRGA